MPERFTTHPTSLHQLEGWIDDRPIFRDPRMIALVMQQARELSELSAFHAQERVRIGLLIGRDTPSS